jgi:hypothetical protein
MALDLGCGVISRKGTAVRTLFLVLASACIPFIDWADSVCGKKMTVARVIFLNACLLGMTA